MTKQTRKQSGGVNINDSDLTVEGDIVGGDKIENHGPDPYQDLDEFHAGGCLAKGLMVLGIITIIGGFISFAVMGYLSVQSFGQTPTPFIGWGVMFVGMITYAIGRTMAHQSAYRQKRNSRRR